MLCCGCMVTWPDASLSCLFAGHCWPHCFKSLLQLLSLALITNAITTTADCVSEHALAIDSSWYTLFHAL